MYIHTHLTVADPIRVGLNNGSGAKGATGKGVSAGRQHRQRLQHRQERHDIAQTHLYMVPLCMYVFVYLDIFFLYIYDIAQTHLYM